GTRQGVDPETRRCDPVCGRRKRKVGFMNYSRLSIAVVGALCAALCAFGQDYTTWKDYGGGPDAAQYSALKQINRGNVERLEVAWTYPMGDGRKYLFNPIVVDGVMYVLAKNNSIVALDAATGKEIWTYQSGPEITVITNRGI